MKTYGIILTSLFLIVARGTMADFNTDLHDALFRNYSKNYPPTHDQTHLVNISLSLQLIQNLDLFRGTLHMNVWRTLAYTDDRLTWDPKAFGNIDKFHVSSSLIWVPDITVWNSITNNPDVDHFEAILFPNGQIWQILPMLIEASCHLDLSDFPYDSHNCSLVYGSWTKDSSKIRLEKMRNEVQLDHLTHSSMWDVTGTSAWKHAVVYPCCEEVYEDVTFSIQITRRESSGRISTAVVSAWLLLAVFLMQPSKAGERIILSGFVFVSLVVLSAALSAEVPAYSVTRMGRFLLAGMILTGIVIAVNSIIYRFYPTEQQRESKHQTSYSAPRVFFLVDMGIGVILFVVLTIATAALFS